MRLGDWIVGFQDLRHMLADGWVSSDSLKVATTAMAAVSDLAEDVRTSFACCPVLSWILLRGQWLAELPWQWCPPHVWLCFLSCCILSCERIARVWLVIPHLVCSAVCHMRSSAHVQRDGRV